MNYAPTVTRFTLVTFNGSGNHFRRGVIHHALRCLEMPELKRRPRLFQKLDFFRR
jgi:hypothetical protein